MHKDKHKKEFMANANAVTGGLKFMAYCGITVLAAGSAYLLNQLSRQFFSTFIEDSTVLVLVITGFVILVLGITDLGLAKNLPYALVARLKNKKMTGDAAKSLTVDFDKGVFRLALFQIVLTLMFSVLASSFLANDFVKKPEPQRVKKEANNRKVERLEVAKMYDEEIANQKRMIQQTKGEGHLLVEKTLNSKGKKMRKLYEAGGNSWADGFLEKRHQQAIKDSADLVLNERRKLASIIATKNKTISQHLSKDAALFAPLLALDSDEITTYQYTKDKLTAGIKWVSLIAMFAFVFATYLLSLFEVETGEEAHSRRKSIVSYLFILIQKSGDFIATIVERKAKWIKVNVAAQNTATQKVDSAQNVPHKQSVPPHSPASAQSETPVRTDFEAAQNGNPHKKAKAKSKAAQKVKIVTVNENFAHKKEDGTFENCSHATVIRRTKQYKQRLIDQYTKDTLNWKSINTNFNKFYYWMRQGMGFYMPDFADKLDIRAPAKAYCDEAIKEKDFDFFIQQFNFIDDIFMDEFVQ